MEKVEVSKTVRYEIVLLDDDPDTIALLEDALTYRGIRVYAYARSEEARQKILDDPNIGALLTDIEIREYYPDGPLSHLQGYDVANRILTDAPNRLLSVIVMTQLNPTIAFRSLRLFTVPIIEVHKDEWSNAEDDDARSLVFDELADLLKQAIERTPYRFYEEVVRVYPTSRWIKHQYWQVYRSLWLSKQWTSAEAGISKRATAIFRDYLEGETRRLRKEILSFPERAQPNEVQFLDHLIGRRVVYALKALHPAHWETMICGERVEEEKTALDSDVWESIKSEEVRALFNHLQNHLADNDLARRHENLARRHEKIEPLSSAEHAEQHAYIEAKAAVQETVRQLAQALREEHESVQKGFVPYLRFWELDFTEVDWTQAPATSAKDQQNLKNTLLLLGIRQKDIKDDNPENWMLLLPEERLWLKRIMEEYGETRNHR